MSIDPTRPTDIRTGAPGSPAEVVNHGKAASPDTAPRADHVEISDEARALAATRSLFEPPLLEVRLAEIRERLAGGFYREDDIMRVIADQILESGDL